MLTRVCGIALALVSLALTPVPTAGAASTLPAPFLSSDKEIHWSGEPTHFISNYRGPGTLEAESSDTDMFSPERAAWSPLAFEGERVLLTAEPGRIICVRIRAIEDTAVSDWSMPACSARALPSASLASSGPTQVTESGIKLFAGAALTAPGQVPDNSRVAVLSRRLLTYETQPSLTVGDDPEPTANLMDLRFIETASSHALMHLFPVGGTVRVNATSRALTSPVVGLAVLPPWMTPRLHTSVYTQPSAAQATPLFLLPSDIAIGERLEIDWENPSSADFHTQLQVQRGTYLTASPEWQDMPIEPQQTGLVLHLAPGETVCFRVRGFRDSDQMATDWHSVPHCTTRMLDDSALRYRGRSKTVSDPLSEDGRVHRMRRLARGIGPVIPQGAAAGYVAYMDRVAPPMMVKIGRRWPNLDGSASTLGIWYLGAEAAVSGRLAIVSINTGWSPRLLGYYVEPPWVRHQ